MCSENTPFRNSRFGQRPRVDLQRPGKPGAKQYPEHQRDENTRIDSGDPAQQEPRIAGEVRRIGPRPADDKPADHEKKLHAIVRIERPVEQQVAPSEPTRIGNEIEIDPAEHACVGAGETTRKTRTIAAPRRPSIAVTREPAGETDAVTTARGGVARQPGVAAKRAATPPQCACESRRYARPARRACQKVAKFDPAKNAPRQPITGRRSSANGETRSTGAALWHRATARRSTPVLHRACSGTRAMSLARGSLRLLQPPQWSFLPTDVCPGQHA